MPDIRFEPQFNEDGQIIDFLSGNPLEDHAEERIRQKYLKILHYEHHYPKNQMDREVPIYYGRQELVDVEGHPKRADIIVYEDAISKANRDQGRVRFVVENKAPSEESGHNQLVSYIFNTSANGAVWFNGPQIKYYRRLSVPENNLIPWPGIPRPGEMWDAIGRWPKDQLETPQDITGLLSRCHNKLHRRGTAGDDITLDMVRILIAKCRDEEKPGNTPEFYCTPEEYTTAAGRELVAERIKRLFEEFRDANPLVFNQHETIQVDADQIAEVVSELQHYRLVSDDEEQWDIMGAVYEEYTADTLKREGGEFFTNRIIVNALVKILDPETNDVILDPAGGTGGFCTSTLRYLRKKIRESRQSAGVKKRLSDQVAKQIFYIDIKNRLVKIAKSAMLLTGDGHQGCIQGDSLKLINTLDPAFLERCRPGLVKKILTNPPFAGLINGRITDQNVLMQFELGKRWEWNNGKYVPTQEISRNGAPPETLFLERCIEWLSPNGLLGIVQPKGVLDTTEFHLATRNLIFRKCKVLGIINCHKNTFQPYTGTRTTLLILQKKERETELDDDGDYPIFMAVSRKIGQDSEGKPIFKMDEEGESTNEIDHDLDEIYSAWLRHKQGILEESEYFFSVNTSMIDRESLIINPQRFLPSLNESLRRALEYGERDHWTAETIGGISQKVYKGGRFKREDLETEDHEGDNVKPFYTPAALLQERGESVKYLDLSRCNDGRRKYILKHVLRRGQIVVTRSGSVGRVMYITSVHEGVIGSDDLIRIEIDDEPLRLYVYGYLKTQLGQDQMKRNEYGTIQQHLEPRHVREVIIPIPDDRAIIDVIANDLRRSIESREESHNYESAALDSLIGLNH